MLCAKFSLPNPNGGNNPDAHKLLFNQVQEFIIGCNGEQVRFAPDTCEYIEFSVMISINMPLKQLFHKLCNKFILSEAIRNRSSIYTRSVQFSLFIERASAFF